MRRFFLTTILSMLSCINVMTARAINIPHSSLEERTSSFCGTNDDWVILGEVTLSNYDSGYEPIIAKLHVREIAKNLIYRVEYQGGFYATIWHGESKTYHVTINGKIYRCDVPVNSTINESKSEKSAIFVGKWVYSGSDWYVDISFINGSYSFRFNPNIAIVSRKEVLNGIEFTYVENKDYSLELDEGEYYYTKGSQYADKGYSPNGTYKYDQEIVYTTATITFSDKAPVYKTVKTHTYYLWREERIYAETDTAYNHPIFSTELTRY